MGTTTNHHVPDIFSRICEETFWILENSSRTIHYTDARLVIDFTVYTLGYTNPFVTPVDV